MNSLSFFVLFTCMLVVVSAGYIKPNPYVSLRPEQYSPPADYRPVYIYDLSLNTGNHSFNFKSETKITLDVNGQIFSYTNYSEYSGPNRYIKRVVLDFSLENDAVKNVTVQWSHRWFDYPKDLIFRPLLQVKSFTITPIRRRILKYNRRSNAVKREIDLDKVNRSNQYYEDDKIQQYKPQIAKYRPIDYKEAPRIIKFCPVLGYDGIPADTIALLRRCY